MTASMRKDPRNLWPEGELATATDFVRHFGHYAASAASKPVYIAQHGRVGWALLSAAEMTRLSETGSGPGSQDARFEILLDSMSTIVLLIDRDCRVSRMNSAARRHFQVVEASPKPIAFRSLLHESHRDFIGDICTRVLDSGDSETFEIESALYPGRTMRFHAMPFPTGLAVLADVVTQAARSRQTLAISAASDVAADMTPELGRGRIDIRGTITTANGNLAALAKSSAEEVVGTRLSSLFESGSADRILDAVDDLLGSGTPFSLEALMLNGANLPVPVTVGAGAERDGPVIVGAVFVVVKRCQDDLR